MQGAAAGSRWHKIHPSGHAAGQVPECKSEKSLSLLCLRGKWKLHWWWLPHRLSYQDLKHWYAMMHQIIQRSDKVGSWSSAAPFFLKKVLSKILITTIICWSSSFVLCCQQRKHALWFELAVNRGLVWWSARRERFGKTSKRMMDEGWEPCFISFSPFPLLQPAMQRRNNEHGFTPAHHIGSLSLAYSLSILLLVTFFFQNPKMWV